MGPEAMEILYPDLSHFSEKYNECADRNMEPEMLDYLNTLWENIKMS